MWAISGFTKMLPPISFNLFAFTRSRLSCGSRWQSDLLFHSCTSFSYQILRNIVCFYTFHIIIIIGVIGDQLAEEYLVFKLFHFGAVWPIQALLELQIVLLLGLSFNIYFFQVR